MTKRERSPHPSERPWSVPLAAADVPETGRHVELAADAQTRDAIASLAGLLSLPRLTAAFDVSLRGRDGLRVAGRVTATVEQACVVTLEPIENEVDEEVDVDFLPGVQAASEQGGVPADDGPEPLINGSIDLGAIATEFLLLGIDPYPRKAGVVFETAPAEKDPSPFAALAALKKGGGGAG